MSSIVVSGDTSGSVTLSAPAIANTTVLTLPSVSGTVLTSASSQVNGPAFSYYLSSSQTITASTQTAIAFNTKVFDTATAFNNTGSTVTLNGLSAPAYAFCPPVAGYYQVTILAQPTGVITGCEVSIYKNGSGYLLGPYPNAGTNPNVLVTGLVYLNGTGDYINGYIYSTGTAVGAGSANTNFMASMVRSA